MREVLKNTWFAAAMFLTVISSVGLGLGVLYAPGLWVLALMVLVVVPSVWWPIVARRAKVKPGRGALAGALVTGIIFFLPFVHVAIAQLIHGPGDGEGQIAAVGGGLLLVVIWLVAVPVGALTGTVTALLQMLLFPRRA